MNRPPVTGLILAGGLGRRMGGQDKGLVPLAGRPLVEHVLERLRPQVENVLINANRNLEVYARLGHPLVPDRLAGFVGPLAGLDAALNAPGLATDWVLSCPCDSPFLPSDLAARLLTAAIAAGAELAMASVAGQYEPAFLLAHRRTAAPLEAYLAADGRRIDRWVLGAAHVVVDFSDCPAAFANLNTPEELARQAAEH